LIKNNPYNSEEYKFLLENKLDSKNKEDLRTYLINSQSDYEDGKAVFAGYRSHYYNIKKIFDTLGLTFPILPDGLFEACGKIQDDVHLKIDSV
jgi:hypothetical protein